MAKTIKFNLILDNKPVRTIEELQENFCIDDIQEFYENGLLQKWLKVRGYDEYLKKVDEIKDKKNAINKLVEIFGIETSKEKIEEGIYSLKFWEERRSKIEEWNKKSNKIKDIISNYHDGYEAIKEKLIANKDDFPFIKSSVEEIGNNYEGLFHLDFCRFFDEMEGNSPLSLFAAMMNCKLRDCFDDEYKNRLLKLVCKIKEAYFKVYSADTGGFSQTVEYKKTKVMVLQISQNSRITSEDNQKRDFKPEDVNGKFQILNGLCFKSINSKGVQNKNKQSGRSTQTNKNSKSQESFVKYMEV